MIHRELRSKAHGFEFVSGEVDDRLFEMFRELDKDYWPFGTWADYMNGYNFPGLTENELIYDV